MKRSKWRARLAGAACDPLIRSWLFEPASLTARCQRASRQFLVRLLHYGKGAALADESAGAGGARGPAWVREVVLECDGQPVIFAHTTLASAGNGRLTRWMAGLGNRSLGSLLFAYPGFRRGPIEILRLDARHPLYRQAAAEIVALRARLAAAERLATAAAALLAAGPGEPEAAAGLRAALEQFRPSTAAAGLWTSDSKLAFLQTFTGPAPLTQLHFIEFARRLMADDPLALGLAERVRDGELTRDELLAAVAASPGA